MIMQQNNGCVEGIVQQLNAINVALPLFPYWNNEVLDMRTDMSKAFCILKTS